MYFCAAIVCRFILPQTTADRLIKKSVEAFILGIEIYNKPTIKYRVEGFSFFICNAWELMLKARLISSEGPDSIFYPNNPDRTITLENCIQKIFTNKKDPLRLNLEKIIELRNTSTHYVTEDYEMIFAPLFQACIFNFIDKMSLFHNIDVTDYISQNFITLAFRSDDLDPSLIRAKYSSDTADKLLKTKKELESLSQENNPSFSIEINHNFYITKKAEGADATVRIAADGETPVKIIKEQKDPSNTHKYSRNTSLVEIHNVIEREKIPFSYHDPYKKEVRTVFTTGDFQLFLDFYDLKQNPRYTFKHVIGGNPQYSYSHSIITFIVDEIRKDPTNIIKNIKNEIKKRNKKKR